MTSWKVNQEIYHRLNHQFSDDLNQQNIITVPDNEVVDWAVKYFTDDPGWVYPSKSYVVAICYAKWLTKEFGEMFYSVLDDPDLLYNNDPYFKPYSQAKETYDSIIKNVGLDFDESTGVIPDIRKYFDAEFLIND